MFSFFVTSSLFIRFSYYTLFSLTKRVY